MLVVSPSERNGGDVSERCLRGARYFLETQDIYQDGDVTLAALDEGVLVALAGQIPAERLWVEVAPTGESFGDLLWGQLPLYEVLH